MAKLTGLTKNTFGLNSGANTLSQLIKVSDIQVKDVFENLIPINENDLNNLAESMKVSGFDVLHPVCIWKEENILVDGHTRRQAAIRAGLEEVYCFKKSFPDEKTAIEYAINEQIRRRNLDDVGKIMLIEKLDSLKKTGRPSSESEKISQGKSSEEMANLLGVGSRTVEKARSVIKDADDETKAAVKSGDISINKAYNKVQEEKKKTKEVEKPIDDEIEEDPFAIGETDFSTDDEIDENFEDTFYPTDEKEPIEVSDDDYEEKNAQVKAFVKTEVAATEPSLTGQPKIQLRAVVDTISQFKAEKMSEYEHEKEKFVFAMKLCDELKELFE